MGAELTLLSHAHRHTHTHTRVHSSISSPAVHCSINFSDALDEIWCSACLAQLVDLRPAVIIRLLLHLLRLSSRGSDGKLDEEPCEGWRWLTPSAWACVGNSHLFPLHHLLIDMQIGMLQANVAVAAYVNTQFGLGQMFVLFCVTAVLH